MDCGNKIDFYNQGYPIMSFHSDCSHMVNGYDAQHKTVIKNLQITMVRSSAKLVIHAAPVMELKVETDSKMVFFLTSNQL